MTNVARVLDSKLFDRAARWLLLILSGIMVFHFVFLRTWGVGTFESFDRDLQKMGADGAFTGTPFMDGDGSPSFARYARSPAGRYLHIFPAGLWSIIAPLQLNPTLRSKYRKAHRYMGRLFILMSFAMAIGLPCLIFSGATKLHDGPAGFRQFKIEPFIMAFDMYFTVTAALAIYYARRKRYAAHRAWVLRHVAMGYSVHTFRLLITVTKHVIVHFFPGYEDPTPAGAEVRNTVMARYFYFAAMLSIGSAEMWIRYKKRSPSEATVQHKTD